MFFIAAMDEVSNTSTFDNATIRLEIVTSVLLSALPGSSHAMTLTVNCAGFSWTQSVSVTAVPIANVVTLVRIIIYCDM